MTTQILHQAQEVHECESCEGTGRVVTRWYKSSATGPASPMEWATCSDCAGSGLAGFECKHCGEWHRFAQDCCRCHGEGGRENDGDLAVEVYCECPTGQRDRDLAMRGLA